MNALFEAKKAAKDPTFLVHTCADIIATARECFDYLAQDIIECHIIPGTSNQKLKQDHAAGKVKAYFPFYASQVTKPGTPFFELSTTNASLYQALLDFAQSIANDASIPNTLFTYKLLLYVKDMVNEKKHDKLIAVVSNADREYLIENDSMKMLLPMSGQSGWSYFFVEPGSTVQKVTEYRFAFNDQEVGKFCLFATKATERVIGDLYQAHFA
ncbi:MAG: hypothetical protein HY731_13740 [Candidatus Tectomicrobia bacterium]|nr:hypothetical protein [Candidatus Tectomicrobia bacterium]